MRQASTVSSTATVTEVYNNISVQLQPTILLSTWCAVCYVRFIVQQRQILLDNVHSTAALWGEIECSTVRNVLLSTWYAVCYVCFHNSAKTNANLSLRHAGHQGEHGDKALVYVHTAIH